MKKRKNIIIAVVAIVLVLIGVFLVILLTRNENSSATDKEKSSDENGKVFNYTEKEVIASNEYYQVELKDSEATLDDDVAYSIDYNSQLPCANGERLKKLESLSGITTAGLFYGYPNVSIEELGVESEQEARLATQFAIWRLAQAEGVDDAKTLEYIFDMDNLKPCDGYEDYLDRVKVAAQKIVENALADPYYANPTFNIENGGSKVSLIDDNQMIVGPYALNGSGYNVTNIEVSLEGAPESALLCDVDGNIKTEFSNKDNVYIKVSQNVGEVTFNLRVDTEGNHCAGVVYGTGVDEDMKQNFCVWEQYDDELDAIVDIELPKLTGAIQVNISDNKNTSLSGVKIKLKDTQGNELKMLETDENGVVLFDDLLVGEYVIEQVCDNETYVFMDVPVQTTVQYNVVNEITLGNVLIEGRLKVISVGEDGETSVSGITYEIFDESKNVIETLVSDEDGVILSKMLEKGTYYFREIAGPEEVHIDNTERMFEISDANVVKVYTVMHYYAKAKIQFGCTDMNGNPIQDIVYEIYNTEEELVDTLTTDADGMVTSQYLLLGDYYYKCLSVPDDIVLDDTKYDFKLSKKMQILECWIEFENK